METPLERAIEHAAHLLPAQGPITVFIHHNTLHSFEHLRFEEAVVAGGALFGCEPYLAEERYRAEYRAGRIRERDLEEALGTDPGAGGAPPPAGFAGRADLRRGWLKHGVPEARGPALDWLLSETDVLDAARPDLPAAVRTRLLGPVPTPRGERRAIRDLWVSCRAAVSRCPARPAPAPPPPVRHRDVLVAAAASDPDALVHPLLIRLCAAYLDQGLASWPMPDRDQGFFRCVARLYGAGPGPPSRWMGAARRLLAEEVASGRSAPDSIERSLAQLGVGPGEWVDFLAATALALRGWAGMMRQVEERPDRVPVHAPPATLADFLAVRLLLDRAAAGEIVRRELGGRWRLAELRAALADRLPSPAPPSVVERAWPLFHLAQILGRNAADVAGLSPEDATCILGEIATFDGTTRRRLLHLAYERSLRHRFYDAVSTHAAAETVAPRFEAVFCIDEREESIRRHLEEVAPASATFGVAGFFGVAMYYRGADESHPRPLCPVGVHPEHEVEAIRAHEDDRGGLRIALRRAWGRLGLGMALGSRTVVRGTIGTLILGALAALPLFFRVLFPRLAARILHRGRRLLAGDGHDRLLLERRDDPPSLGRYSGFTTEEMTAIVRRLIEDAGLAPGTPLVLIVGHGSTSLNNPHESAHDCGACGGGRGGPNARVFARMANDPEVRRRLAGASVPIPSGTWFVGAEHNSATDAMTCFDLGRVPPDSQPLLREAMEALAEARLRNAHERCRRFRAVPPGSSAVFCLAHVEGRAEDLAQTRPEYGHATNAFCVVGRRARTRGLFLDRRAFLVSYDPTRDDAGATVLERVLAGIVPVVAGISLEYYFAFVDPTGYGCGTKLPHNVTALLGVMDGHASDLRTGLPIQMVEIHEPVRLTLLVETPAATLLRLTRENPGLGRLVAHGWIVAAALDPDSGSIHEIGAAGPVRHTVAATAVESAPSSADWYGGRREFLGFARVGPAGAAGTGR